MPWRDKAQILILLMNYLHYIYTVNMSKSSGNLLHVLQQRKQVFKRNALLKAHKKKPFQPQILNVNSLKCEQIPFHQRPRSVCGV